MHEEKERGIAIVGAAGQMSPTCRIRSHHIEPHWLPTPKYDGCDMQAKSHFERERPVLLIDGDIADTAAYEALKIVASNHKLHIMCNGEVSSLTALERMRNAGMQVGEHICVMGSGRGVGKSIFEDLLRERMNEINCSMGVPSHLLWDDLSQLEPPPTLCPLEDDDLDISTPLWAPKRKGEGKARSNFCGKHRGGKR